MNAVDAMTERMLDDAGVGPGMRVLDIGCGSGNVSFMIAQRVGATGRVYGVDRDERMLDIARFRQKELGLPHVSFVTGNFGVAGFEDEMFDASVGRRVLMYQSDPVEAVRKLARVLKPGGRLLFHEHDTIQVEKAGPPLPLHDRVRSWLRDMLLAEGADIHMGLHLHTALSESGMVVEHVRGEANVLTPTAHYPVAPILRAALPRLQRHGIASEGEIDIDTLDDRLIEERRRAQATCVWEIVFCAIARKPEQI